MIIYYVGVHRNNAQAVFDLGINFSVLSSYEWYSDGRKIDGGGRLIMNNVCKRKQDEDMVRMQQHPSIHHRD